MKVRTLVVVALIASLLAAGPGLPAARAAGGVYNARTGTPITGLPMTGWTGTPILRIGQSLRVPGTDLGRSLARPNVSLTPGIELAAPVETRLVSPGMFAEAARLTDTLSRDASLMTIMDIKAGDSQRLSAVNKIYDNSAAAKDAAEVPGADSQADNRLTASKTRSRARVGEIEKLARRSDAGADKAGARVEWRDVVRWSAGLVGVIAAAAVITSALYGLYTWVPPHLATIGILVAVVLVMTYLEATL